MSTPSNDKRPVDADESSSSASPLKKVKAEASVESKVVVMVVHKEWGYDEGYIVPLSQWTDAMEKLSDPETLHQGFISWTRDEKTKFDKSVNETFTPFHATPEDEIVLWRVEGPIARMITLPSFEKD